MFDRKYTVGKKCTGIISRTTFEKLNIPREFIDRGFKTIFFHYKDKIIEIKTDVLRLNRVKLEKYISQNVEIRLRSDVKIINNSILLNEEEKIEGLVINASGWKGKSKWVKAIEYLTEPIDSETIDVFFDERNKGGFSWIVPLPYGTLVGALGYKMPDKFIPKINKRILEVHGGGIPRPRPTYVRRGIGDVLGLIKIFTGGGIFSISEMLPTIKKIVYEEDEREHLSKFRQLSKEISRQQKILEITEKFWGLALKIGFTVLNGKTLNAGEEFDLHSLFIRRSLRSISH
ncbi:NAD(P)/FAD-dependent oxidoreductase [Stygiolobus caldivivus]|uniref:NAD(P)/FAD-dependent oxidoreductase n=1 Tax=Stygiolobus caldivivus TaxID=2824673 RepID=A0A8D5U842_9CREN|nr:hypothetical protein [Stygiolobus caldivivus]BCU71351.1 hypothetical protein KN1_26480 [Stygiolobus caldivivus]